MLRESLLEEKELERCWIDENRKKYLVDGWGDGYFRANSKGNLEAAPCREGEGVDLYEMISNLALRGIKTPILLKFNGIIEDRVRRIYSAFHGAISLCEYKNCYRLAYPIKVNQQKQVVDVILAAGKEYGIGIEIGSKPELLASMSVHNADQALLLCNGYKDAEYIELALLAKKIQKRSIIIVEQFYELELILQAASKLGISPEIGLRMKPHSEGSGRWASSGGSHAKFGLNSEEILRAVDFLAKAGKKHWLKLLHYHSGSQMKSLSSVRRFLEEGSRMYVALASICEEFSFFDIGGGLAVDYVGMPSSSEYRAEYTLEEYAQEVVSTIGRICNETKTPHPTVITESGRALVAHHSVLVTEVVDTAKGVDSTWSPTIEILKTHPFLEALFAIYEKVDEKNCYKSYREAEKLQKEIEEGFIQGVVTLSQRAHGEKLYLHLAEKIRSILKKMPLIPKKLEVLGLEHPDMYFCNFSIFQSLPDVWAIGQVFPVMPIHRLHEEPKNQGTLVDLTCDSDGKIDHFITSEGERSSLPLHELNGSPYYLGFCLVGAYQEILGGLHNLFGDTHAVHVAFDKERGFSFQEEIKGASAVDLLESVQYTQEELLSSFQSSIAKSSKEGGISSLEGESLLERYKKALGGYTYLDV